MFVHGRLIRLQQQDGMVRWEWAGLCSMGPYTVRALLFGDDFLSLLRNDHLAEEQVRTRNVVVLPENSTMIQETFLFVPFGLFFARSVCQSNTKSGSRP